MPAGLWPPAPGRPAWHAAAAPPAAAAHLSPRGGRGRDLMALLAERHPDLISMQQRRDKRGDRVYADIMRNAYAQTVVAPLSVRARPGAPVATPLHWPEVSDGMLRPDRFTLRTVPGRLEEMRGADDLWAGLASRHYSLPRAAERLSRLSAN